MKTALLVLGLAVAFFGVGLALTRFVFPRPADAEAAEAGAEAQCADDSTGVAPLAADLDAMRVRLAQAEARADSLRRVIDARQETTEGTRADVAELAVTVAKMEGDGLAAVVQRLDGRSFVRLYEASSGRNRGRLLGALTPAQAAAFVRHQIPGGAAAPPPAKSPAAPASAAPDTTTAPR